MGIKGLNKFLERHAPHAFSEMGLDTLRGTRVAIDAYNWIYTSYPMAKKEVTYRTDVSLHDPNEGEIFREWMNILFGFIKTWLQYQITPVFVFDGVAPLDKNKTRLKRREDQKKVYERMMSLKEEVRNGDPLRITPDKIMELRKRIIHTRSLELESIDYVKTMLKNVGIPSIQAKYEGEQVCAMLAREGKVSAVYSTDTDNLVYGAPLLITRFTRVLDVPDEYGYSKRILQCKCVWVENILKQLGYTRETFVDLCILAGCDYNENMPKIGIFTAHKLLNQYHAIDRFPAKYDTDCLRYERCRTMFSPVQSEELWEEGFLNVQSERIGLLGSTLEEFEMFDRHFYLINLLYDLERPAEGRPSQLQPLPVPTYIQYNNVRLSVSNVK